jgi:acetate kinase
VSDLILAINTGSSSLKASVFSHVGGVDVERVATYRAERIGGSSGRISVVGLNKHASERELDVPNHAVALGLLRDWIGEAGFESALRAVGHRVVHGGVEFRAPTVVTPSMLDKLDDLVPIDPEHLPQAITAMRELSDHLPVVPHVALFDTAFHRTMPRVAQMYPLPKWLADASIIRFGFHGLSCESIMHQIRAEYGAVPTRIIIAHLGNGSSMTAVLHGQSVETTMGFTPTGGLMMGTRTGDLDPGVLLHVMDTQNLSIAKTRVLLNKQSGLLGVSGSSSDMRDLVERRATDSAADDAISLYCYTARKAIGALAAVLGGLDLLVFTGGIGEHAAPVRAEISAGLQLIGIEIDPDRNERHAPIVSLDSGNVTVRVIQTDEESVIARHASRFVTREGDAHV